MKRKQQSMAVFGALVLVSWSSAGGEVVFNRDIRPILSDTCYQCHGPDQATREAGLRLDIEADAKADRGGYAAVAPGNPAESELVRRITHPDPDEIMPPKDSNRALSESEIGLLKQWIAEGAPWQGHWAFIPPNRPESPGVNQKSWARNPIDRFVLARLEEEGLQPAPEAGKRTLIRRVSLDLTGLPPTPGEVEAFVSDPSPKAYEKVVDRLLNSPRYGERMAWTWLEAARYADTDGYQNDGPREMWRWRDWVIDAYNRNMPFDRFTIEQLAGDLLPNPTLDQWIATGFNRNHRYNSEAGLVLEEFLLENAVDRVDTTSTVWMGLTMGCARCHSHKFDPFTQEEYYQLISYFNNVPESGRAIKFGNSEPWIKAPTEVQRQKLEALDRRIAAAKKALAAAEPELRKAVKQWAESGECNEKGAPFLQRGLDHHFDFEAATDEVKVEKGGPVFREGLVGKAATVGGSGQFALGKIGDFRCNTRFSLAFWMKPEEVSKGAVISKETQDTTRKGLLVELRDGHLRFHVISRWIAGVATLETLDKLPPGEWVHVSLTNDGTQRADGMQICLNGKPVPTRTLHNTNSNKAGKSYGGILRIGGSPHAPHFKGQVDELRIYSRTLWPDEIRELAVPATIAELAARPPGKPTARETAKLQSWFLEHKAPAHLKKLSAEFEAAREARLDYWDSLPTTMVMVESRQPRPTHIRIRGVYDNLGPEVKPGVPESLGVREAAVSGNRLDLARWLVHPAHPLTARVTVNRYWQMLFGQGLVRTPEDFGSQGEAPTHPDLLDWLATEFIRLDWNVKAMMKTIVMSATYRQSSDVTPELQARDPENRLLARAPRLRLAGNVLRDQALFVGGLLVDEIGGPSVKPYQPANLWREASNFTYRQDKGAGLYRRSLYTYWKRTLAPPSMAVLDTADREWCSVRPKHTNTPLQALTLLNETTFVEAARSFAERVLRMDAAHRDERLARAFEWVVARIPTSEELEVLRRAHDKYLKSFREKDSVAGKMLKVGDSQADKELDPVELGAMAAYCNLLLNLDEATTRE